MPMRSVIQSILDRPLIALTILYCAVLTILNCRGFFDSPPKHDVARFISPYARDVTGYVSGIPEEKNSKQVFTVRVTDVDGRPCGGKLLVHYYSKSGQVEQGDPVSFHCVLMRPPPAKNPGGFDYEGYLRRMNIYTVAYVSSLDKIGHGRTPFYRRLAQSVNLDMNETIDKALPQSESAVLIPMLIGNKQNLSYEEKQAFTDAGVMHILVVSGLKVAYVAGTFLLLFRLMGLKRRLASLLSIPFLLLYMAVTGNNPPVVRATIMAISIFISLSLNRSSLTYQALALAAAVILIFDPQALFTASFQLSFAATIGIVYLYPRLIKPFQKFPAWFRNPVGGSIAVSLASQLGVMPLLSFYFHKIFFAGIISNILIVPLTGVITGLGIVLYLVHFISGPLTSFAAWITSFLIKLLMLQVHYFANLPYAAVHVATPALWVVAVYYLILCGIVMAQRIKYIALILGVGGIFIFAKLYISHLDAKDKMEITSLYAGSGTAVHIAFPGGNHWLIDCGRVKDGSMAVCPYLWDRGVRKLDKIIITSDDKRHCGGLKTVTDNFPETCVIYPSSVTARVKYFVNGSTVTLIPSAPEQLTVLIDFAGSRTIFADPDNLAENLSVNNVDVLHISCRRNQKGTINSCIDRLKPSTVILSGTAPKEMPDKKNYYALNKCGAVTVAVSLKGISVKGFIEEVKTSDTDAEE